MTRPVFLVGSAPFDPAETFRRFGDTLRGHAARLPDGEQYGWLPTRILEGTPGVVRGNDTPIQATGPTAVRSTLRLADGVVPADLLFEGLHYCRAAMESYQLFREMRDAGHIAQGTRFQIGIPTPFTALLIFDWDVVRAIWPVYEQRLLRNVAEMVSAIPHEDFAISWDVVAEFMLLSAPSARDHYTMEELAIPVGRLIDSIPTDVETGLHFCYGRHNSRGEVEFASPEERSLLAPAMRDISDTELMVNFFAAVHGATERRINWLHIPVPRKHDDPEFYAPLANLPLEGVTELYLGLLHLDDGIEQTKHKLVAAESAGVPFGVAAPCGFRASTSNMPSSAGTFTIERSVALIDYHREVAEL